MNRTASRYARITATVERAFHTVEAEVRIQIAAAPAWSCAIEPATLARLFEQDPAAAWLALARLSDAQLVVEAIDYTAWLNETSGRDLDWYAVLEMFEKRIARLARKAA